jgi:hypothetical protein
MLLGVINQLSLSYLRRPTLHRTKNIVNLYELELTVLYLQTFVHLYHDKLIHRPVVWQDTRRSVNRPTNWVHSFKPQTFPTIENNTNTKKLPLPLGKPRELSKKNVAVVGSSLWDHKKNWASLLGTTHLRSPPLCHSTSWRWRPGWWADTQQTSLEPGHGRSPFGGNPGGNMSCLPPLGMVKHTTYLYL